MLSYYCLFLLSIAIIVRAQYGTDSSFDSLVSSQCRTRCFGLYPWHLSSEQPTALRYFRREKRDDSMASIRNVRDYGRHQRQKGHNRNQPGHVKWNRIMEMCAKNENCLQCTLPCDIPTNLLANCKYLCKDNNKFCMDSCDLLTKLSQDKDGSCPAFTKSADSSNTIQLLISAKGQLSESNTVLNQCSSESKANAISALLQNNKDEQSSASVRQCGQDSDCGDIKKCCPLHTACPQYGNVCARPIIQNNNIPARPFNLTIIERKRGKTVILKWRCNYRRNQPTLFVVEGRWSLKPPTSSDDESHMTKWGYLAQTINNNWIILRNINRGRWYKFRVSAITKSGTLGYSVPTESFILSSAPQAPSKPQNLTIQTVYEQQHDASVSTDLTWLSSRRSDLPIVHYKLSWRQENSNNPHYGFDLIQEGVNKYTIRNLMKDTLYSLELIAVSMYDGKELKSQPVTLALNTNEALATPHSSYLISAEPADYLEKEDEIEDEDLDLNYDVYDRNSRNNHVQPSANQNRIRDLTVKNPYFRNGLVKAKLSWLLSSDSNSASGENINSASINSIVLEQPVFTITWFPNKCVNEQGDLLNTLPTPITASTINTNFEIYDIKYNCDYVVNVRLDSTTKSAIGSSSLNPAPPQLASVQFKVPSCDQIEIVGKNQPRCYHGNRRFRPAKISPQDVFFVEQTTTPTTQSTRPQTAKPNSNEIQLPRVYNIRHRVVNKTDDFYSVRFSWSLPKQYIAQLENRLISGFQISVVPKAIPGFGAPSGISSIGAIVEKGDTSFEVKQLRASVTYIFQIQILTYDQSYGPASTIEFEIQHVDDGHHRGKQRVYSIDDKRLLSYSDDAEYDGEFYLQATSTRSTATSGALRVSMTGNSITQLIFSLISMILTLRFIKSGQI